MLKMFSSVAAVLALIAAVSAQQTPAGYFDGKSWWAHVKVLADDNMEGRETGSDGLKRAQAYAVQQFQNAGLLPSGTDGYYQPVRFISREIIEKDSSLALVRNGVEEPLVLGEDAYFSTRIDLAPKVDALLVFVGYGLQIPEKNYDDLAGLDLKNKVAVVLTGSPAEMPAALASHYQSLAERWKAFRRAGVIGQITLPNPNSMDIPWSRMSLNRAHFTLDLADGEFNETEGARLAVTFNPAKAQRLFVGSAHTFEELAALGKERRPLPRFPLGISIKARAAMRTVEIESSNLVAILPGSDPKLKNEYVVLSAHLDHLGIGEPINGDRIYNGAMDNGSGSALLLDMAASFRAHPERLRRSILFLLVTAEEKGLLGSKYFAAHPTVDANAIVADVNVDMFLPIVPLKVLRVLGLTDSDLGDRVTQIANSRGVRVQPDPEPLRNSFIRSDQYSFIRGGVPSLKLDLSFDPGSPEQKIFKDWLTNRYHAPSDDVNQPVNLSAAALYEEIVRQLLINVANSDARPAWKPDSFFRRFAAQYSVPAASTPALRLPSTSPDRADTTFGGSLRRGAGGEAGAGGGDGCLDATSVQVLTPDQGVDLSGYLGRVVANVKKQWYSVMPESARKGEKGCVIIDFKIMRDGSVPQSEALVQATSGKEPLDRAALDSIRDAGPFEPLPSAFNGPYFEVRFLFLYNLPREAAR